jgi:hypothetical protein
LTIDFPETLSTIGECAFRGCLIMTNVTIPKTVTTIGDNAFLGCGNYGQVTGNTSVIFLDHKDVTIICEKGSAAEKYAQKYETKIEYIES